MAGACALTLTPIEPHIRRHDAAEDTSLLVRGWPLTVDGLLRNADATRARYALGGEPFVAVSVELVDGRRSLEAVLAGPRMRTRRRYAVTPAGAVIDAGFRVLPTFAAPHWSIVFGAYTSAEALALKGLLGATRTNPYFEGRRT
jgi:hypothetical protein